MLTITEIKKAINVISYEFRKDDEIKIRVGDLITIKKMLEDLEEEVKEYKKLYNIEKNENKRLTGKLIEKESVRFRTYV